METMNIIKTNKAGTVVVATVEMADWDAAGQAIAADHHGRTPQTRLDWTERFEINYETARDAMATCNPWFGRGTTIYNVIDCPLDQAAGL